MIERENMCPCVSLRACVLCVYERERERARVSESNHDELGGLGGGKVSSAAELRSLMGPTARPDLTPRCRLAGEPSTPDSFCTSFCQATREKCPFLANGTREIQDGRSAYPSVRAVRALAPTRSAIACARARA
jgi:hypothetical protein